MNTKVFHAWLFRLPIYLCLCACMCARLCPTLCNLMDGSPPDCSVHGIPRQQHWSGLPFPPPGDLSDPRIEPGSPECRWIFYCWTIRETHLCLWVPLTANKKSHGESSFHHPLSSAVDSIISYQFCHWSTIFHLWNTYLILTPVWGAGDTKGE